MLKIVALEPGPDNTAILRLEGRVVGPWVEEVRRSCESVFSSGTGLTLDLSDVSFVDREGVDLLRSLCSRHANLVNCSPFVAALLKA